ncbi:MAG: efflux RND transporter periplasmic adaptor subunit [Acidobacteriota bacterium]
MTTRAGLVTTVAVAAAIGVVVASRWAGGGAPRRTVPVTRGEFRATVQATGRLEAAVAFEVGPPSARGFWQYNLSWMVPEGSQVEKGKVVARFDATEIAERLRKHRADLETTLQTRQKEERNLQVDLRRLDLDLVKAEGELKTLQVQMAVPQDLISSIEIRELALKNRLAQRRHDYLREKIAFQKKLVRSKLDLLDAKKEFYENKIAYNEAVQASYAVRAPVAGMVVYIPKQNGERWEVGEGVWMLAKIMKIADISTLQIEADVLEIDSARIAVGQPVRVDIDALPGVVIESRIAAVGRMVHERSAQDPSKVFDAIVPLGDVSAEDLRPGMGVHVVIETSRRTDVLTLPLEAVRMAADGPFVEVVAGGGGLQRRSIRLGEKNSERVIVREGVRQGDVIALPPEAV